MSQAKRQKPPKAKRAREVIGWMAQGLSSETIRSRAESEWGMTPSQIETLLKAAGDDMVQRYLMTDRHVYMARVVGSLEHVTEVGIQQGQLASAVQAMALLAKLCAIGAEHDPSPRRP